MDRAANTKIPPGCKRLTVDIRAELRDRLKRESLRRLVEGPYDVFLVRHLVEAALEQFLDSEGSE